MSFKYGVALLFLLAFVFRILLIPVARHGDINNNTSWGQLLLQRGPVNFYEGKVWAYSAPNQPPLYIGVFAATAFIQNSNNTFIHWANTHIPLFPSKTIWWFDSFGELYIAKLPGIFADLAIGFFIYRVMGGKKGVLLASVWLFNPVSWYNSSIWGGTDSIVNLLGLLSVYFLYKKNLTNAAVFFTLSFMFKGSLLVFIPVFILIALKTRKSVADWLRAAGASIVVFLIASIAFHPQIDIFIWFYRLYTERFLPGEIGSLTANAFNVWWLVNPGPILDSTLYWAIPARLLGLLLTAVFGALVVWKASKMKTDIPSWFSYALLSFISFLFMTRIHERYLYPFFPIATISLAFFPWSWIPYVLLSVVHLFNLYNLFWAPGIPALEALYVNQGFEQFLSVINIVSFMSLLYFFLTSKKHLTHGK